MSDTEDELIIPCWECGIEMDSHFEASKHHFIEHTFIGWFF